MEEIGTKTCTVPGGVKQEDSHCETSGKCASIGWYVELGSQSVEILATRLDHGHPISQK